MNQFNNKISQNLEMIENLEFSILNCIRLISIIQKILLEFEKFEEDQIEESDSNFFNGIKQIRDNELSDLINFSIPDDLKRLFDNVKSEIELDKNNYWSH